MGSLIYLSIGAFEIDWGKNDVFSSHGELFQAGDVAMVPQIYWDADEERPVVGMSEGAARSLRRVLPRLRLLGHSLEGARAEFKALQASEGKALALTFDQLKAGMAAFDVDAPPLEDGQYDDPGEYVQREVLGRLAFRGEPPDVGSRRDLGLVLQGMSPGSILSMLALNLSCCRSDGHEVKLRLLAARSPWG